MTNNSQDLDTDRLSLRSPKDIIVFIKCFLLESSYQIKCLYKWFISHLKACLFFSIVISLIYTLSKLNGPFQENFQLLEKKIIWCAYWVLLGILSSIGLGTGLHTFILYLGPHIASVTLAAYECKSLDFQEPPYPDEIICPNENDDLSGLNVTILSVVSKVKLEAFMWGLGTAIGELPPYLMAKAARISGQQLEDDDDRDSKWYPIKKSIETLVKRVGFFGILLCASIPNPLFDFAGFACGHFLVPFWTFFGATAIGKAVIKVSIQTFFVVIAFNEDHFETFVDKIRLLPFVGEYIQGPFREFLIKQKNNLHRKPDDALIEQPQSWLAWAFENFVFLMVVYFILTIVYSMAQSYHNRQLIKKKKV